MKILILNEMFAGVTANKVYDVIDVDYQDSEGYKCEKEVAKFETFRFINDDTKRTYEYRDVKTKKCTTDGNEFRIFETDLDCAKYLIEINNLNVEVKAI
jgi:hypothetical protein